VLFLALHNDSWTTGTTSGYDGAIVMLFVFVMVILVDGNVAVD